MKVITADMVMEQGKAFQATLISWFVHGEIDSWPEVRELRERWMNESLKQGLEKGREKGLEEGLEKGLEKGLEEGLEKGLEKGLEEGLGKGQAAMVKAVARTLAIRFGGELDDFSPKLQGLSLSILDRLSEIAFSVNSLAEFEQRRLEVIKSDSAQ